MPKPSPISLQVISTKTISPHMRRLTLAGEPLSTYSGDQAGGYVKLFLSEQQRSLEGVRTYTIAAHRPQMNEIDVDFVIHGDDGLASRWAQNVCCGDWVKVGGPGAKKPLQEHADWYFVVGDMTALPAIRVNLKSLPASAVGYVVLEAIDAADCVELEKPERLQVSWLVTGEHPDKSRVLNQVKSMPWLEGDVGVWAASEFDTMKALRGYFKKERGLSTAQAYISSYWKLGMREDQHKKAKALDSQQQS